MPVVKLSIITTHRRPIGYNRYISNSPSFPTWDKLKSKWIQQFVTNRTFQNQIQWFVTTKQRTWVPFIYMVIVLPTIATLRAKHGSVLAGGRQSPPSPDLMRFFMKLHMVWASFKRIGNGSYMITAPQQQSIFMIAWSYFPNLLHSQQCKQLFQMLALRGHLFYNSSIRNQFPFPTWLRQTD